MTAWAQTVTGRPIDFAAPIIHREHLFTEVAAGLAKINRFAGQTDLPYSVAQHSVLAAEAALDETGDVELAAFVLLHDGHEFLLVDRPSPAKYAELQEIRRLAIADGNTGAEAARLVHLVKLSRKALETRIDAAIFTAAGLDPARHRLFAGLIREYDLRSLLIERAHLMRPCPRPWDIDALALKPLRPRRGAIAKIAWPDAEARFCETLSMLCPASTEPAPRFVSRS